MSDKKKGMLCIMAAAFCFAFMNLFVRLSGDLPSMQKAFFRNIVAAVFAFFVLLRSDDGFSYPLKHWPMLFCRSFFGVLGIVCNFYAISHLNISDASMLNKLSPFFAIIFSAIFLKEKANRYEKIAVFIAFVGALFVIKPSPAIFTNPSTVIGALSGLGAGIAYTCVRKMGKEGMKGARVVFFFSAFSTIVLSPFLIFDFHPMTGAQLASLIMAGVSASGGQFSITAAYNFAPAKEISVFDYTQVVFAALLGFVFIGQIPDIYSVIGYIIIIGVAVWRFKKQQQ